MLPGNEVLQTTDRQTDSGVYRAARSQLKTVIEMRFIPVINEY